MQIDHVIIHDNILISDQKMTMINDFLTPIIKHQVTTQTDFEHYMTAIAK